MTAITTSPENNFSSRTFEEKDTNRDKNKTFRLYKSLLQSHFFTHVETQVNFLDQNEIEFDVSEKDMNDFAYAASASSLNEYWDDEDDEYWNSYL